MILDERTSGVLLHVTSLPGPHGIGDFGPGAYHFVDWLAAAGQRLWQVLPLTPIGPGDSPYQSVSAFAGSPLMVALEPLVSRGWLADPGLSGTVFEAQRVDYARVMPWRMAQLRAAAQGFFAEADAPERMEFEAWCAREAAWLDDYALFMALEAAHGGACWWDWAAPLARREPQALADARRVHAGEIAFWQFVQWCFDRQWRAVRAHAHAQGIAIVGDLPIFVAHHSADCWARPDLFLLDPDFQPRVVAGVPPDFFSADGQRWGNPLYDWDAMAADGYRWWSERIRRMLAQADVFRIDHFRGFAAHWEIPADCPTAVGGRWVTGPGRALFDAIAEAVGPLPIIAEDLGVITPDVEALRDDCGFPGMRILQFAFGGDGSHAYLPHNHVPRSVAYTGTHDNDTSLGWWRSATERERAFAATYLGSDEAGAAAAMLRATAASPARTVLFPMQDVLGLDGTHRMNVPGLMGGNWSWRFDWAMVAEAGAALGRVSAAFGRAPIGLLQLPG
jgi:4-alpha-glucanotransferase